jgi:hypothetical protein
MQRAAVALSAPPQLDDRTTLLLDEAIHILPSLLVLLCSVWLRSNMPVRGMPWLMSAAQVFVAPSAAFGPLTASSCPKAHFKAVCGVSIGHGLLAINLEAKEHQYVYVWAMDGPEDMGRNHKMSQARSIPLALKKPGIMVGLDSKRGFRQRSRGPTQGPADQKARVSQKAAA